MFIWETHKTRRKYQSNIDWNKTFTKQMLYVKIKSADLPTAVQEHFVQQTKRTNCLPASPWTQTTTFQVQVIV